MMQKDEASLLEPWLRYHSHLFGTENIHVFDNGSTDLSVLKILDHYEQKGIQLERGFSDYSDFSNKGGIFLHFIRENRKSADFFFPLDCDEFISYTDPTTEKIHCDRASILKYLNSLKEISKAILYKKIYQNIPGRYGEYFVDSLNEKERGEPTFFHTIHSKMFFASGVPARLDRGFHDARTEVGGRFVSDMSLIHYHAKPYPEMIQSLKRKMSPRLKSWDRESLLNYKSPKPGWHLIRYLLMDEKEYLQNSAQLKTFSFGDFHRELANLGATIPF